MEIGERIRQRREELDMTQDELAHAIGYKWRSSINKIELNSQNLPQKKIVAIAKALKVTPSYLMGWEDKETAEVIAMQEDIMEKFFSLSLEHQEIIGRFIDTLLEQEKG